MSPFQCPVSALGNPKRFVSRFELNVRSRRHEFGKCGSQSNGRLCAGTQWLHLSTTEDFFGVRHILRKWHCPGHAMGSSAHSQLLPEIVHPRCPFGKLHGTVKEKRFKHHGLVQTDLRTPMLCIRSSRISEESREGSRRAESWPQWARHRNHWKAVIDTSSSEALTCTNMGTVDFIFPLQMLRPRNDEIGAMQQTWSCLQWLK